jgi:hypothetical protein
VSVQLLPTLPPSRETTTVTHRQTWNIGRAHSHDWRSWTTCLVLRIRTPWHYQCVISPDLERSARTVYEAHRGASSGSLPPWEDTTEQEQQAWKAAVSAVTGQGDATLTEGVPSPSLVVQAAGQTDTFPRRLHRRPPRDTDCQRRACLEPSCPLRVRPWPVVRPRPRLNQRHLAQRTPHLPIPAAEKATRSGSSAPS